MFCGHIVQIAELRVTSLCNETDLDRARDLVRRDLAVVNEWIEGVKTPETDEIRHVSSSLRRLANKLQTIRRRNERITA